MKIDLYTRCWNDAHMLPFLFRHYDPFVQRYIVFDDGSTDNSLQLLRNHHKVDLRVMPPYSEPDSRVFSARALLDSCWKESRGAADWVIVADIDEHLFHPNFKDYLAACKNQGVTIIPALGYQMVSETFPPPHAVLSRTLTRGAPAHVMNKLSIFSPDDIKQTNYAPGLHTAAPQGRVIAPARDELLLLHYKFLDFERMLRRHQQAFTRQRERDIALGLGVHYSWPRKQLLEEWNGYVRDAVDISAPDLKPWSTHKGPRWWDGYPRAAAAT
jgi:glycosyltransferase involved in cell wall biosynthesis